MRDPRTDPAAGDVVRLVSREVLTIVSRERRRPGQCEYGLGTAKEFIRYLIQGHPGITFNMAVSGFKKRAKNAKVIKVA